MSPKIKPFPRVPTHAIYSPQLRGLMKQYEPQVKNGVEITLRFELQGHKSLKNAFVINRAEKAKAILPFQIHSQTCVSQSEMIGNVRHSLPGSSLKITITHRSRLI